MTTILASIEEFDESPTVVIPVETMHEAYQRSAPAHLIWGPEFDDVPTLRYPRPDTDLDDVSDGVPEVLELSPHSDTQPLMRVA